MSASKNTSRHEDLVREAAVDILVRRDDPMQESPTTESAPMYVVVENTPGYLPEEEDPYVTDNYAAAVAYMNDRVQEYADSIAEGEGEPIIDWGIASAGNYAAAYVTDASRDHDLGRWFSVELDES